MPAARVTFAAVSSDFPVIGEALKHHGVDIIVTPPYKELFDNLESTHADMQILHLGGNKIVLLKDNDKFNNKLIDKFNNQNICKNIDISHTASEITDFKYPECVKLNFALVGNNAIGCFKYADEEVLKCLDGYNKINVKQGYAKCSVAVVNENAIITADNSISKAAKANGIDCLKISEGHILLGEKWGGFIGGSCFLIDKNVLAFTGDIKSHPDYIEIKAFCLNYGVNLLSLTNGVLCDVGGIVPLMQMPNY